MTKQQISNTLSWLLLAAIVLYLSYSKGWIFAGFESIAPKQAYERLKKDPTIFLLDVRSPEEYSQEFIKGSTLIPVQELESKLATLANQKGKTIIVYCHSGNRSVKASRILAEHGFQPLNMKGGIAEWKSSGLPIEVNQ